MIACWNQGYCRDFGDRPTLPLFIADYQLTFYANLPPPPDGQRRGTLYMIKKNKFYDIVQGRVIVRNQGSLVAGTPLDHHTPKRQRIEMFAAAERFYSYDAASQISVEAALAGCLSIVVPVEGISKEQWLSSVGDLFK